MNNCPDTGNKKELQHWVRQLWIWWRSEVLRCKRLEDENRELKSENRKLKKGLYVKNRT